MQPTLIDYMTPGDRNKITDNKGRTLPTYHTLMFEATGKCRPGKTARDRARGTIK